MRLKNQNAGFIAVGKTTPALLAGVWNILAKHGNVSYETKSWELDSPEEITPDMLDGFELKITYQTPGGILGGWVIVRPEYGNMLRVFGSTDTTAHQLCAMIGAELESAEMKLYDNWEDARTSSSLASKSTRSMINEIAAVYTNSPLSLASLVTTVALLALWGAHTAFGVSWHGNAAVVEIAGASLWAGLAWRKRQRNKIVKASLNA